MEFAIHDGHVVMVIDEKKVRPTLDQIRAMSEEDQAEYGRLVSMNLQGKDD